VRDLAIELGKDIELNVEGKDIELDRTILEEIADPLVHLLRNAVDHGFETPEQRKAAGKSERGYLNLAARREKNQVTIVVEDDGRGMDPAAIKRSAVKKGILSQEQANQLSRDEAINLVALPGFSTMEQVSRTSGRGVGVDAVKTKIESLGGSLRIDSELGRGSRFQLRLPLTLAIIQALMVRQGKETYAVPVNNISEAVEMQRKDLDTMHKNDVVMIRDEVLPVQRLGRLLEVPGGMDEVPEMFTVLVAEIEDRHVGLMVDEVLGQQEIAIKSLGRFLKGTRGFGGVTIQGDGTLSLILDIPSLL
jgi:two-component system chemotaxis sensor kinase CheA